MKIDEKEENSIQVKERGETFDLLVDKVMNRINFDYDDDEDEENNIEENNEEIKIDEKEINLLDEIKKKNILNVNENTNEKKIDEEEKKNNDFEIDKKRNSSTFSLNFKNIVNYFMGEK